MDIKDLEYFLVICRHQNLAKAARSLYITPQGLSRIVKNLEAELGTALLRRTGNSIALTDAGRYLEARLPDLYAARDRIREAIEYNAAVLCRFGQRFAPGRPTL